MIKRTEKKVKRTNKRYSNPFFAQKKKSIFPVKVKIFASLTFFLSMAFLWFIFYSSHFKIREISVQGEGKISTSSVEQLAWDMVNDKTFVMLPYQNIFFFNTDKISEKMKNEHVFDFLTIEKNKPGKLEIKFREKECSVIWNEDDKYFFMDEAGLIITEVNLLDIKDKKYPIISNETDYKITDNRTPVGIKYISFTIDLFKELSNTSEIQFEKFIINKEDNTVKLSATSGPYVLFSTEEDIKKQIKKVLIIKKDKLKEDFAKKEYVDVRIGNSVYYK